MVVVEVVVVGEGGVVVCVGGGFQERCVVLYLDNSNVPQPGHFYFGCGISMKRYSKILTLTHTRFLLPYLFV